MDFYAAYKSLGFTAEVTGVKDIKGKETYEVTSPVRRVRRCGTTSIRRIS